MQRAAIEGRNKGAIGWADEASEMPTHKEESQAPAVIRIKIVVSGNEIHAVFNPLVTDDIGHLQVQGALQLSCCAVQQRYLPKTADKPVAQAQRKFVFVERAGGLASSL